VERAGLSTLQDGQKVSFDIVRDHVLENRTPTIYALPANSSAVSFGFSVETPPSPASLRDAWFFTLIQSFERPPR
jgi:hypothetical protein